MVKEAGLRSAAVMRVGSIPTPRIFFSVVLATEKNVNNIIIYTSIME